MLPNYLIIGAARSGTGWLAKNLMLHPEVFMHNKKELHYFESQYDKGIDWYKQKFKNADAIAIGEGTPSYLYYDHVAELIKKHMPDVKLIVSLRDPVDRAYSHYLFRERERQAQNQTLTFEQKIDATPRLVEEGQYARKLQRYYDIFPKENILVVLYDELKNDPENYLKRVYSFLGVSTEFRSPLINKEINSSSSKMGKSVLLFYLYKLLVKIGLFRSAEFVNNLNKKEDSRTVSNKTRERLLQEYYLDDLQKLEAMINQDLSKWKKI
jgi:hypothetical protein